MARIRMERIRFLRVDQIENFNFLYRIQRQPRMLKRAASKAMYFRLTKADLVVKIPYCADSEVFGQNWAQLTGLPVALFSSC